ncbi:MAG: hypothetical protein WA915_05320 [Candidatus Aminicenantaceae bacterium]
MKVKLEKWYLDFTSRNETGFYYIMIITIGRYKIGFSGINHFDSSQQVQNFKISRLKQQSFHNLKLSKAALSSSIKAAHLKIDHGKIALEGNWTFRTPPIKRWRTPLYEDPNGWVDWKVWTPYADVELLFRKGKNTTTLRGTGYIDFVRLTLPFWKLPFHTLYWGRMHSQDSWSVFLSLQTNGENITLYLDPQTRAQDVSVSLERNELGEAQKMIWRIDSSGSPLSFEGTVTQILEKQEILAKGRSLRILPKGIRRKLSSSGRDEKYRMVSRFGNQPFRGIMEEVRYHD